MLRFLIRLRISLGDVVQLTAVLLLVGAFSGWSGDLSGSANPMAILLDGNKTVTATFTQNSYTLTVNLWGVARLLGTILILTVLAMGFI